MPQACRSATLRVAVPGMGTSESRRDEAANDAFIGILKRKRPKGEAQGQGANAANPFVESLCQANWILRRFSTRSTPAKPRSGGACQGIPND